MSRVNVFLVLSFLVVAGVNAEDPPQQHFKTKNSSLCLHSRKEPPYKNVVWTFNGHAVILGGEVDHDFIHKVIHFDPKNVSLCISNLTENDSGIYKLTFFSSSREVTERHNLIVQEAVSKPVLELFVPSLNDSAGVCNVSVNCSIGDEWSASVCSTDSCRTTSSSFRKVNISISVANRSVVCNGTNQVSSNTESTKVICSEESSDEPVVTQESFDMVTVTVVSCVTLCFIIASILAMCCSAKYKDHQEQCSLPQLIQSQRGGTLEAAPPLVPRASSSSEAEVSYENVDVFQQSQTSSDPVNSIYCLLQAPKAAAPAPAPAAAAAAAGSKDAPGPARIQDAASSLQTVAVDETEQFSCVSEYSAVQKPKTVRSQHPLQAEQDSQRHELDT
ncbi:uncharacterized protein V6R79_005613 [Siganus canaliculatus]